ncbi:MAG: zf-TFIIB domain-containing protein [Polyangiaceae bacterium]
MTAAYRASQPMCPSCREPLEMHELEAPRAVVDLCKKCGGVWIDWEDGDLTELSRAVPGAEVRVMPRSGAGGCPRCNRPLAVEVFMEAAEVLRCGECAGAFVPYPSIGKIAGLTPAEAREKEEEIGVWGRVAETVRGWLRGGG